MKTDTRWRKHGRWLFLSLGFLLASCRSSQPPKIEICILDGLGGGDCVEPDGSKLYKVPSTMVNYWATSQPDQAKYSSWCYDTSVHTVNKAMAEIFKEAKNDQVSPTPAFTTTQH